MTAVAVKGAVMVVEAMAAAMAAAMVVVKEGEMVEVKVGRRWRRWWWR